MTKKEEVGIQDADYYKGLPRYLNLSDFGSHIHADLKSIEKAVKLGRIKIIMIEDKKRYDWKQCSIDWYKNTKRTIDNEHIFNYLEKLFMVLEIEKPQSKPTHPADTAESDETRSDTGISDDEIHIDEVNDEVLEDEVLEDENDNLEIDPKPKPVWGESEFPELGDSRRKAEHFAAQRKELEFKQKAGELIYKKEIEDNLFELARKIRNSILALPPRFAPDLAGEVDPQRLEIMLTKELNKCLEELSNVCERP